MSFTANASLTKVARGTGIILVGAVLVLLFGFIGRVMLARYGTESDYGVFSLALVILNVLVLISTPGLQDGVIRYIAYFREKNDLERVRGTISTAILFASLAGIFLGLILFFTADIISTGIFHNPELAYPLRIFAIGVPLFALINILASIFLGFGRVDAKVYFQDILRSALFPLLLIIILLLSLPFTSVFPVYLGSIILSFVGLVIYVIKRSPLPIKFAIRTGINLVGKELLLFSFPLFGVGMFQLIIACTDTLMLGYFKTSEIVGVYNAAYPLAQSIFMPMGAMVMIYLSVISGLYSQNRVPEIRRTYTVLTKWIFSVSLPIFLMLFLFPESVLNFFFGANYIPASQALRILSLGYIIVNLLGPNGVTLTAIGKTRFLLWASLAAAAMNVILNIALIPPLGIVGASIATAISLTFHCIIRHVKVHSQLKVNPLSKNLLKPAIISTGLIFLVYIIAKNFLTVTFWMLPLLFILFCVIYFLAILFSKSFDQEDIMMLLEIEKKAGINLAPVKKILAKFCKG